MKNCLVCARYTLQSLKIQRFELACLSTTPRYLTTCNMRWQFPRVHYTACICEMMHGSTCIAMWRTGYVLYRALVEIVTLAGTWLVIIMCVFNILMLGSVIILCVMEWSCRYYWYTAAADLGSHPHLPREEDQNLHRHHQGSKQVSAVPTCRL